MRDSSSSEGLASEAVELSEGILGIIGAYGMPAGATVGVVQMKDASPPREGLLMPANARSAANVRAATG
jgi:hypothetical protein